MALELSEADVVFVREYIGDAPDTAELVDLLNTDGVGSKEALVRHILSIRLANFEADPASFNVAGEYSQDTKANIEALTKKIAALTDAGALSPDPNDGVMVPAYPRIQSR